MLSGDRCFDTGLQAALAIAPTEFLAGFISLGSFGEVPQIARREVNTAVLVEDGQTVVIGGVYEFSDTSDISKVPFLGDIPLLGNLFRYRTNSRDKRDLMVFLPPKILTFPWPTGLGFPPSNRRIAQRSPYRAWEVWWLVRRWCLPTRATPSRRVN